ncbi:hypothetical protein [Rhodococcus coprophilus]|uniref:hypothetical protein n=1 Tax=Rhodococcus coprophilus TaxID=38310 RepID=UPI000A017103|nr:hypothetical protein [Rhodococcus coprophilus]
MSDNNGERRSFRSGGSTPWSGRGESKEGSQANRGNDDRRQTGDRREDSSAGRGEDRRPPRSSDRTYPDRAQRGRSEDARPRREGDSRPRREGDARPNRGDDRSDRASRPQRDQPYGDRRRDDARPARSDDRRPNRSDDRRPSRSDDPRARREGDARPNRSADSRPSRGDDRGRQFGDRDRPSSDRPRGEGGRGDRPHRPSGDRDRTDNRGGDTRGARSYGGDRRGDDAPRRRGGEGGFGPAGGRDGANPRRDARPDEPDLPENVEASELDPTIRRDLLSLDKLNANTVARHLVMAGKLIDDDPRLALAHARAARQRAGRIAVVREAAGITAYHAGEWAEALSELRAARRMSGGTALLAVMADCERGLGRPEKAIELGRSEEARALTGDEASELRIVVAGARMDLGQYDQAVVTLQTSDLDPTRTGTPAARLFYAYADALVAAGRAEEGVQWFLHAAEADIEGVTDAEDRVEELTGGDL